MVFFTSDNIVYISRSGSNLVSKSVSNGTNKVKSLRRNFLTERIIKIWNKLPFIVKSSSSVKDFKINLERFKKDNMEDIGSENEACFWRVSNVVLSKIEGVGYLENKRKHNEYLVSHPYVAKKLFINMKNYNGSRNDL